MTFFTQQQLTDAFIARHGKVTQKKFAAACIGIAGLGGLGSHIAIHLARLGIGHLVLVDYDNVELSNLHRQHYRLSDIGSPKTDALVKQLKEINPYLHYETHKKQLTAENIPTIFSDCAIICEAFDAAQAKAMLSTTVLRHLPQATLIACSGMAGAESANKILTSRRLKRFYLCGDGQSDISNNSIFSPRVNLCATHAATMAMRLLLGFTEP